MGVYYIGSKENCLWWGWRVSIGDTDGENNCAVLGENVSLDFQPGQTQISLDVRKPVFRLCENKDAD